MHKRERLAGRFPQFKNFQTQLPDGTKYRCGPESVMFNAGVIGVRREDSNCLKNALAICDALMFDGIKYHVCEQFAVSEALRIGGLKIIETHEAVAHYNRSSAKRYMHAQLSSRPKDELWKLKRPIPYSYPRVQLRKWMEKICK